MIDCGPDFRIQALRANMKTLDGMILTHAHYDHIGGLDDLRAYFVSLDAPIPCLLSHETEHDIKRRFDYMFRETEKKSVIIPKITLHEFESDRGEIDFLGLKIKYLSYSQMHMPINGIICGDLAYVSDIKHFPDTIFEDLKGIETLIVSALRFTPSAMDLPWMKRLILQEKQELNARFSHTLHMNLITKKQMLTCLRIFKWLTMV